MTQTSGASAESVMSRQVFQRKVTRLCSLMTFGLWLPVLACFIQLIMWLSPNQYPEVKGMRVERLGPVLDEIIPNGAKVEMIADGFEFTEGPRWIRDQEKGEGYLIFSDVPKNKIWKWEEGSGIFTAGTSLFLDQSGCKEGNPCSTSRYPGATGVAQVPGSGELIICEHGNRRVTRLEENGVRTALATHFNGRQLNSPNDLVFSKRGDLYFSDPPFGFEAWQHSPEYSGMSGIFRIPKETFDSVKIGEGFPPEPELVEGDLLWPNGLAFSPDNTKLYVSHSSMEDPAWYVYEVAGNGSISNRRTFIDPEPLRRESWTLVPDGLEVDDDGNIFAAGPSGVVIVSHDGSHLGTIYTGGVFVSNVVIGGDGYLYMTASHTIMRVKVSTKPLQV